MTLEQAFINPSTLETERLVLRPLNISDISAIHAIKSDVEVTEQYGVEPKTSAEETRKWVEGRIAGYAARDSIFWILTLKGNDRAIGSVCYWNFEPSLRCAEIGYELGRAYWSKGIMSEALPAVISFGFREMDLHRIEGLPLAINEPSKKVLTKLGFRREGTFRERVFFRSRFIDQLCYGLLENEWGRANNS